MKSNRKQLNPVEKMMGACAHPLKVRTPTGDIIYSDCGRCANCLARKSIRLRTLAEQEEADSLRTWFITLTYNPQNLPLASFLTNEDDDEIMYYCVTPRLVDYGCALSTEPFHLNRSELGHIIKRQNLNIENHIAYAPKEDLQKFLKRFRYYLKKKYNETVRFFAVSEYGSRSYRPHFHLLVYSNSLYLNYPKIQSAVDSAWKYGFNRVSLSRHKTASYTASYCCSFGGVPSVLQQKPFRPFNCHSIFFGQNYFLSRFEDYLYDPRSLATPIPRKIFGEIRDVRPSYSTERRLFPRIPSFQSCSHEYKVYGYSILLDVITKFPSLDGCSLSFIANNLVDRYLAEMDSDSYHYHSLSEDKELDRFLHIQLAGLVEKRDSMVNKMYHILCLSRYFLNVLCGGYLDYNNRDYMVHLIEHYYACKSLSNLSTFYTILEEYSTTSDNLEAFYDPSLAPSTDEYLSASVEYRRRVACDKHHKYLSEYCNNLTL